MTGDPESWAAAAGLRLPDLESLPLADGVVAAGFPAEGGAALDWWHRLHRVSASDGGTGFRPVLIPSVDEAVSAAGGTAGERPERLARAAELDVPALLGPRGMAFEDLDPDALQQMLDQWPETPPCRLDGFNLPFDGEGRPARVIVALVEAEHGWQIPPLLDYGFWNDCPEPAVHGAVLRHWQRRYGAELVCLAATGLELALTRPPRSRTDALAFAWEYAGYCLDGMDLYDAEELPDLAACLVSAETVRFWWD